MTVLCVSFTAHVTRANVVATCKNTLGSYIILHGYFLSKIVVCIIATGGGRGAVFQENRGLGLYNYLICKTFSYSAKEFSEAGSFKVY